VPPKLAGRCMGAPPPGTLPEEPCPGGGGGGGSCAKSDVVKTNVRMSANSFMILFMILLFLIFDI